MSRYERALGVMIGPGPDPPRQVLPFNDVATMCCGWNWCSFYGMSVKDMHRLGEKAADEMLFEMAQAAHDQEKPDDERHYAVRWTSQYRVSGRFWGIS